MTLFLVPVKFSDYKEIELLMVKTTRYLGFRVKVSAWDEDSFLQPWSNGEERELKQNLLCFGEWTFVGATGTLSSLYRRLM